MRNLLQKLPFPVEFAVVVAGAYGYSIITSVLALAHIHVGMAGPSEFGVWRVVAFQAITTAVLGLFLWARGWKAERFGLDTHWRDGPWGLVLAAGAYLGILAVSILVSAFLPSVVPQQSGAVVPTLSPYAVAALVLVNGFYEEFFAAGYLITALKEKGHPDLGINIGVALRVGLHISQGVSSVVLIPIGLIFGTWYARSGRLWPLILAHVLLNAWSYSHYIKW
ncbi:CPBP family intramembrane glutamic endopeptidase [Rhizomicrobium electricum]|uniref:CPBP family intramembrane metalloprotease n=1 Tax=Rhizomicrobium electricum TaxID=480070 RepID=A0ABN1E5J9_9PROT|nr:type II CAAX endopeptidase family protein [Rhizomicrobium electricum]NIJ47711.1 membrane protease YdiL (CAAX protease family) [Rhizomicrobium electricum]